MGRSLVRHLSYNLIPSKTCSVIPVVRFSTEKKFDSKRLKKKKKLLNFRDENEVRKVINRDCGSKCKLFPCIGVSLESLCHKLLEYMSFLGNMALHESQLTKQKHRNQKIYDFAV